ncbi:MAG: PST family polysaccharide transporter [Mariniflexile sp.]|jgi:PST family polysaccharide transporter
MTTRVFYVVERGIRLLQVLGLTMLAARSLNTVDLSEFMFILAAFSTLLPIAFFGIESNLIVKKQKSNYSTLQTSSSIFLLITASLVGCTFNILFFYFSSNFLYALVVSFSLMQVPLYVAYLTNLAEGKFFKNFISYFVTFIISSSLKIYIYFQDVELIVICWIYCFDVITPLLLLNLIRQNQASVLNLKRFLKISMLKELFIDGLPLMISAFFIMAFMRLDQLMLKYFDMPADLASFAIAARLNEGLLILPSVLIGMYFPKIVVLFNGNHKAGYEFLKLLKLRFVGVTMLAIIIIIFLSDYLITFMYGSAYILSSSVFKIQSMTLFFTFYGMLASKLCTIFNKRRYIVYANLLGLFLNFCLNLIFIKQWGAIGAAVATVLTQFFTSYLFWRISPKTHFARV